MCWRWLVRSAWVRLMRGWGTVFLMFQTSLPLKTLTHSTSSLPSLIHSSSVHTSMYVVQKNCMFWSEVIVLWHLSSCGLRSVVVITCASHAQGPQFDPGRRQQFFWVFLPLLLYLISDFSPFQEGRGCVSIWQHIHHLCSQGGTLQNHSSEEDASQVLSWYVSSVELLGAMVKYPHPWSSCSLTNSLVLWRPLPYR